MISARPTLLGRRFWETFSRWAIRWRFRKVSIDWEGRIDPKKSLILIGNHISWWDGFWGLYLNKRLFHKQFHVMMLEEQLAQRPFMRQGGACSINPGSRSMIESLRYASKLLENPNNMLLFFPQGMIHSMHEQDFRFQAGIDRILRMTSQEVQILMYVALPDFFSHPKPGLFFYLKSFPFQEIPSSTQLEIEYQRFFQICLQTQKERIGE